MLEQDAIPAAAILDNWSDDPWTNGLQIDRREDMEKLAVRTRNSLYEITIIEGRSLRNGKVVATVQGQWVKVQKPQDSTVVSDGDKITQVQFGGSDQAFQVQ